MDYLWTAILGAIQGLTECLPVSSSAHVLIAAKLLGVSSSGLLPEVSVFHFGSCIAICLLFLGNLKKLFTALIAVFSYWISNLKLASGLGKSGPENHKKPLRTSTRSMAWAILIATFVAAITCVLLEPFGRIASSSMIAPGIGLFMTAIFLLVSLQMPQVNKQMQKMKLIDPIFIGLLEGFAVFPGISRFAVVLAACSIIGFSRKNSFYLALFSGIPLYVGGTLFELAKCLITHQTISLTWLIGAVTAFLVTFLFGGMELEIVKKYQSRKFFVAWCFLMGAVCILIYFKLG